MKRATIVLAIIGAGITFATACHYAIEITRDDGATVRLDEGARGASIRLEGGAVWTGEALLRLTADATLERRVCVGDALVRR